MRRNWTRDELLLAFNLYCKIPFGKYNQKTLEVINLSKIINRTPSSVAFKLVNFASLDPYHQNRGVKGMKNGSKLDKQVYDEFTNNWDNLIYESESLLAEKLGKNILGESLLITPSELLEDKIGREAFRKVKVRINQSFFRKVILSIYTNKCAVSNINIPELLIASHIIPWSVDKKERLNPSNGICLSPLYDKAFDRGLMTISEDFRIKFSSKLSSIADKNSYEVLFKSFENKQLNLPEKFYPKQEFISYHRDNIFKP